VPPPPDGLVFHGVLNAVDRKPAGGRRSGGAFSLIEILVTIALLTFIILGLVAVFVQTQRAFKIGMSDTEWLETGRALSDLIARETAEMRPSQISNTVNFFTEIPQQGESFYTAPVLQALPGTGATPQLRINYLQPFFFLSRPNMAWPDQTWVATGYYVVPDTLNAGIGTLYRYSLTNIQSYAANGLPVLFAPRLLYGGFVNAVSAMRTDVNPPAAGTVTRVADSVIHLRVRAFGTNGFPVIGVGNPIGATGYGVAQPNGNLVPNGYHFVDHTTNTFNLSSPDNWTSLAFYSNAVPAFLEVELGVLDPQSYQRFKNLDASAAAGQLSFLSNRVAQVHLFRQRIPIRNVDPTAYK